MSLETPIKIRMLQRKLYQKAKEKPSFRFYRLYDKMYREDILAHAYALVKSHQGSPGVDGQSFSGIESQGLEEWLSGIRTSIKQARRERFDFLGYSFGPHHLWKNGHEYLGASPSKKSVSRLRQKVGDLLVRHNLAPGPEVRDQLNRILRGWSNYFSYGTPLMVHRAVDHYVYDRVVYFLRHRHNMASRGSSRFPDAVVYGKLGVLRLRDVPLVRLSVSL